MPKLFIFSLSRQFLPSITTLILFCFNNERLQGYLKADLQEVIREESSLMREFGPNRLSEEALDDLLRYLGTLRGANAAGR